jgi:protein gp37
MSDKSPIEWTNATWNPIAAFTRRDLYIDQLGRVSQSRNFKSQISNLKFIPAGTRGWFCTKVSPGCAHCYAEGINVRLGNGLTYTLRNLEHIEFRLQGLDKPLHWRKPRMIFVNSMTDLFHENVPVEMIDAVFAVMAMTPQHTYQVLTKRAKLMRDYCIALRDGQRHLGDALRRNDIDGFVSRIMVADAYGIYDKKRPSGANPPYRPFPNVWLGVSVEDQERADERIPLLLQTPAAVRFLSCEPLLGDVTLHPDWIKSYYCNKCGYTGESTGHAGCNYLAASFRHIDWIIVGGESGKAARPMHPEWAKLLRDQCIVAGVPFFFKQWGNWLPFDQRDAGQFNDSVRYRANEFAWNVSKNVAGRKLDGKEWNQMPMEGRAPSRPGRHRGRPSVTSAER